MNMPISKKMKNRERNRAALIDDNYYKGEASVKKDETKSLLKMNKETQYWSRGVVTATFRISAKVATNKFAATRKRKQFRVNRKFTDGLSESLTACTNNLICFHWEKLPVNIVKLIPCLQVYRNKG